MAEEFYLSESSVELLRTRAQRNTNPQPSTVVMLCDDLLKARKIIDELRSRQSTTRSDPTYPGMG